MTAQRRRRSLKTIVSGRRRSFVGGTGPVHLGKRRIVSGHGRGKIRGMSVCRS